MTNENLLFMEKQFNMLKVEKGVIFHSIIFISFRHQAREAEPKDYDLNKAPYRDLCNATYNRIGNVTDGVSFLNDTFWFYHILSE